MIIKTKDRTFTIRGIDIREPEWFPQKRKDIFDIWFATDIKNKPRRVPKLDDYLMVDFITGGFSGHIWMAGPIVSIQCLEGEQVGNPNFKPVGPPQKG